MFNLFKISFSMTLNSVKNITGKSKAILVHHGMLGSARNFKPLINSSNLQNSFDTILIDSRNHGQSPHLDSHSVSDLADDLFVFVFEQLFCHKRPWNELILLGHSMGGIAVMELTRRYPQLQDYISKVIIVDIPCNYEVSKKGWSQAGEYEMLRKAAKINLNQPLSKIFTEIEEIAPDENISNLLKFNVEILGNGKYKWKANIDKIANHYSEMTEYTLKENQWRKPVHVIYGSQSNHFKEDQISHYLNSYPQMKKGENFHRIEGAGHWVHFDRKDEFLRTVEKIAGKEAI